MPKTIKNTLIIAFAFILFSCEKTIEFTKDEIKPKIVVSAVASAGRGLVVKIEKSRSILFQDNYFEAIPDAKVLLYENGTFLKQLEYKSKIDTFKKYTQYGNKKMIPYETGNYYDTLILIKEGATYKLEVTRDGLDPVWCETTVPKPVQISNFTIDYKKSKGQEYDSQYLIDMLLKINDRASEDNFYRLNTYVTNGIELGYLKSGNGYGKYDGGYGNPQPFSQTDTIVMQSNTYSYGWHSGNRLFTDELFNGKNYSYSFESQGNDEIHTDLGEYVQVNVVIDNLSKELYIYYRSREEHSDAKDDPFAEPVPVFSNVVGGLGIFGSESSSYIQGYFGKFPMSGKTYINQQTYREMQNKNRN
jgi:hypothetical protein